ncbi:hypothetical protein OIU84_000987 [Salix udensis]|uniref:Homeobox domain-containing protein n=1 Tax=Salix udensis TaxID=889485 RepID=A0AAD6L5W9_9ROSI|nr:hypothetical protein OIU84_000987 [Salix udensis]
MKSVEIREVMSIPLTVASMVLVGRNSGSQKSNPACSRRASKRHTTLNPAQKHSLAERLNLKTRQVEVWFQNRRARTKLKQTEVDCEFLKKCCESLSNENRRLKKELQEMRSQKNGRSQLAKGFHNYSVFFMYGKDHD